MTKPTVHNNTELTEEQIRGQRIVGVIRNEWRQRTVELFEDEEDEAMLFMIGTSFDGTKVVISHEQMGLDEHRAMDYFSHGMKTLVRQ